LRWGILPGFGVDGIIRRVGVHDLDAERAEIAIPEPEEGLTREDIPAEAARIAPRRQEEQRRLEQRGPSKDPSPY